MKKREPVWFTAEEKPCTVQTDYEAILGAYHVGKNMQRNFYKPIPIKKGDVVALDRKGRPTLNGTVVDRLARPARQRRIMIGWVARRARLVVFQEQDPVWNKKTKKHIPGKFHDPYWVACDVTSYCLGCGDTPVQAVNRFLWQAVATNLSAKEEEASGIKVIRWRCLLKPAEVREMEEKARKTGFILDGVLVPQPKSWKDAGWKRIKEANK